MDIGVNEFEFWNMTIAEVKRAVDSFNRVEKGRLKEKATFDYIMADLIGKSVARIANANNEYPAISEVYPTLFDGVAVQEQKQERKDEISSIRFQQFVQSFNSRYKGVNNEK